MACAGAYSIATAARAAIHFAVSVLKPPMFHTPFPLR